MMKKQMLKKNRVDGFHSNAITHATEGRTFKRQLVKDAKEYCSETAGATNAVNISFSLDTISISLRALLCRVAVTKVSSKIGIIKFLVYSGYEISVLQDFKLNKLIS
jgi:hypothetical protein